MKKIILDDLAHIIYDTFEFEDLTVCSRPGLQEFLFKHFRVAVWTAATRDYGEFIVDQFIIQDKPERQLRFFWSREHYNESLIRSQCPKDVLSTPFGNVDTYIIDDLEENCYGQKGYRVNPFKAASKNAQHDDELLGRVKPWLQEIILLIK